jgi:hypothetical protein
LVMWRHGALGEVAVDRREGGKRLEENGYHSERLFEAHGYTGPATRNRNRFLGN